MPLYEYRCLKCGNEFEVIQKFSALPLKSCRKCKGKLEKLLSAPAIVFKGTGWYVTDYARKSDGNGTATASDGTKGSGDDVKNPVSKKAEPKTARSDSSARKSA